MCLSDIYKNEISDMNLLAKNIAEIKVVDGELVFTDIMGIRKTFKGNLELIDLMDNNIVVK